MVVTVDLLQDLGRHSKEPGCLDLELLTWLAHVCQINRQNVCAVDLL